MPLSTTPVNQQINQAMNSPPLHSKTRNTTPGTKSFTEPSPEPMLNRHTPYLLDLNTIDAWPTSEALNEFSSFDDNSLDEHESENSRGMKRQGLSEMPSNTRRHTKRPAWLQDYFCNFLDLATEPKTFQEAAQDEGWRQSMIEEIKSIYANNA